MLAAPATVYEDREGCQVSTPTAHEYNNHHLTWSQTTINVGTRHAAELRFEQQTLQIVLDGRHRTQIPRRRAP